MKNIKGDISILLTNIDRFMNRLDTEETERKTADAQLEDRADRLEEQAGLHR